MQKKEVYYGIYRGFNHLDNITVKAKEGIVTL